MEGLGHRDNDSSQIEEDRECTRCRDVIVAQALHFAQNIAPELENGLARAASASRLAASTKPQISARSASLFFFNVL
jgi:hypothetical protein